MQLTCRSLTPVFTKNQLISVDSFSISTALHHIGYQVIKPSMQQIQLIFARKKFSSAREKRIKDKDLLSSLIFPIGNLFDGEIAIDHCVASALRSTVSLLLIEETQRTIALHNHGTISRR